MTYRGTVRGEVVLLPPGIHLPDGMEVSIEPLGPVAQSDPTANASPLMKNGVPVFSRRTEGAAPGLELVNDLRDDIP
jgi:hypothetical protein